MNLVPSEHWFSNTDDTQKKKDVDSPASMLTKPTLLTFNSEINIFSLSVSLMNLVLSEHWFSARDVLSSKKHWPAHPAGGVGLGPIYFRESLRTSETILGLRNLQ